MPRRKRVEAVGEKRREVRQAHGKVEVSAAAGDPLPSRAERQAQIESLLGLRPGELDPKICEQRRKEHQAAMMTHMDKAMRQFVRGHR